MGLFKTQACKNDKNVGLEFSILIKPADSDNTKEYVGNICYDVMALLCIMRYTTDYLPPEQESQ